MSQTGSSDTTQVPEEEQSAPIGSPSPLPWLTRLLYFWQRLPQLLLLGAFVFCAALVVNLRHLGRPGIWFDEAFSVELARQPFPLLWHIIFTQEPNMELYYLFLHFWLLLTSPFVHPIEYVVRFPSAIFAALSSVVVFLLGRRFINTFGGLLGAGLYLLNFVQLTYAQQTRAYSLQLFLICVAWYALLSTCTCSTYPRRWWSLYVVAMVLAVYSHLFTFLVLVAQFVFFVGILLVSTTWQKQARQQMRAFGLALLAIALLCIPMFIISLHGAETGWLPKPRRTDVEYIINQMVGDSEKYLLALVLACSFGIILVVGSALLVRFSHFSRFKEGLVERNAQSWLAARHYLPICWAFLCWFALPFLLSFAVSFTSLRLFSSRYLCVIIPALCLLTALGVATLRWRSLQLIASGLLLALALLVVPGYYRNAQIEDWNSATHWLLDRYEPDDGLVCYDNSLQQGCQVSVEYYLHAYPKNNAHFTADAPGAFSWQKYGPARPAGPDEATDPNALASYGAKHAHLFFIQGRIRDDAAAARAKNAQIWLDQHYHLVSSLKMPTVSVRLYNTQP